MTQKSKNEVSVHTVGTKEERGNKRFRLNNPSWQSRQTFYVGLVLLRV